MLARNVRKGVQDQRLSPIEYFLANTKPYNALISRVILTCPNLAIFCIGASYNHTKDMKEFSL